MLASCLMARLETKKELEDEHGVPESKWWAREEIRTMENLNTPNEKASPFELQQCSCRRVEEGIEKRWIPELDPRIVSPVMSLPSKSLISCGIDWYFGKFPKDRVLLQEAYGVDWKIWANELETLMQENEWNTYERAVASEAICKLQTVCLLSFVEE